MSQNKIADNERRSLVPLERKLVIAIIVVGLTASFGNLASAHTTLTRYWDGRPTPDLIAQIISGVTFALLKGLTLGWIIEICK